MIFEVECLDRSCPIKGYQRYAEYNHDHGAAVRDFASRNRTSLVGDGPWRFAVWVRDDAGDRREYLIHRVPAVTFVDERVSSPEPAA